jgi:hypothetical protein
MRQQLLHSGVDAVVIGLCVGHEPIAGTQMYLHADLTVNGLPSPFRAAHSTSGGGEAAVRQRYRAWTSPGLIQGAD